MTCQETERLVMPYINHELTDDELEGFLEHIQVCSHCKEELEIYFTVDVGIKQLDAENGSYNIKGALESALEMSLQRVHKMRVLSMIRYGVNTLCTISLLVIFIQQCRIWWLNGVFR